MITGKDEKRIMYARLIGIRNFDEQDYPNKKMIIINHGKVRILEKPRDDIFELMVEKGPNITLGDLRNIALDFVPMNSIFYIHDDDETRTKNYVSFMVDALLKTKSVAVFFKNRLEYNLANGFCFRSHFNKGNTHIMGFKIDRLRYISVDTLEDVNLQDDIASFHKKYTALDNDPRMYIRIIHQNNTSPFATDNRHEILKYSRNGNYWESEASPEEKQYANNIVQERYKPFLYAKS